MDCAWPRRLVGSNRWTPVRRLSGILLPCDNRRSVPRVKTVAVLGSTGSVGTQTLDVLTRLPDSFHVVGLAAGHWSDVFAAQVQTWEPACAAIATNGVSAPHDADTRLLVGSSALEQLVEETQPDI